MMEEETLWEGHPSQITNFWQYTFLIIIGVFTAGLGFLVTLPMAIWLYVSTKKTIYRLTNQRFICERGVFSTVADELELYRVRDTTVSQPFLIRLFGLGHIDIVTTDKSDPNVRIKGITDAKEVREIMRTHVEARRLATKTRDVEFT